MGCQALCSFVVMLSDFDNRTSRYMAAAFAPNCSDHIRNDLNLEQFKWPTFAHATRKPVWLPFRWRCISVRTATPRINFGIAYSISSGPPSTSCALPQSKEEFRELDVDAPEELAELLESAELDLEDVDVEIGGAAACAAATASAAPSASVDPDDAAAAPKDACGNLRDGNGARGGASTPSSPSTPPSLIANITVGGPSVSLNLFGSPCTAGAETGRPSRSAVSFFLQSRALVASSTGSRECNSKR